MPSLLSAWTMSIPTPPAPTIPTLRRCMRSLPASPKMSACLAYWAAVAMVPSSARPADPSVRTSSMARSRPSHSRVGGFRR